MSKRCNEIRVCETCKNKYIAKVVLSRFCSITCMCKWRSSIPRTENQQLASKRRSERLKETRVCSWCNISFKTIPSSSKTMCSRKCMYEWRKAQNWETVDCLNCKTPFQRRKHEKHYRTGLPRQYCSNLCSLTSIQKRDSLRNWGSSKRNHWNNPKVQAKVGKTKLKKYGDKNYNNLAKNIKTCNGKYGVPYAILVAPKSNGHRISAPQRIIYEQVLIKYSDAILEKWLPDAQKSVDIFIPSEKKIIEIYGTYWHCDPRKYQPDYFNKAVKMTAQAIWDRDAARVRYLEDLGYSVEVIWEADIN